MAFFDFIRQTKEQIKQLFDLHFSKEARSERLQRSYFLDSTRSWIDPNGHRLSDRVWQQRKQIRDAIDKILRQSIARGEDATVTARRLEDYLIADLKPVRGIAGDLVAKQAKGVITNTPRSGAGSWPARRLARTEISRAHAAATEWTAARTPFAVGMKWNLSAAHPKTDECDKNANEDNGLGRGVYRVGDFPPMPNHACCMCFETIETDPDVDGVIRSLREKYRL